MNDEVSFLPYQEALQLVGAVMEEEHIHEPQRRVLTVYDKQDRELCWFDAEEIMAELAAKEGSLPKKEDELKARAVELILHQIPTWAAE